MRPRLGLGVALVGALVALLGATVMAVLGPDGRLVSGPHPVTTDGVAIVTAPAALSWSGLQVSVLAELPANKPVFVGLGNAVDVSDFLRGTRYLEVTAFRTPWTLRTHTVGGAANLPSAPTAVDWWLARGAGLGGASLTTTLPDETVSMAILAVGSSNLRGLTVTIGYGLRGGFGLGLGLLLIGLGVLLLGLLLRRGGAAGEGVEEVVYIYVDEAGVEHEIDAADLDDYDIVEEERP